MKEDMVRIRAETEEADIRNMMESATGSTLKSLRAGTEITSLREVIISLKGWRQSDRLGFLDYESSSWAVCETEDTETMTMTLKVTNLQMFSRYGLCFI